MESPTLPFSGCFASKAGVMSGRDVRAFVKQCGPDCANCPLYQEKAFKPVLAEGPSFPKGMLIGEGPGPDEEEQGRPFVGATGKALNEALSSVGLDRKQLWVGNVTACRPPPGMHKDDAAMRQAVECCSPLFQAQLPQKATAAFVMGKHAWFGYAGKIPKGGLEKGRGFIRELGKSRYIASWHPTYAFFYNQWEKGAFLVDLERFARLVKGILRKPPERLIVSATPAHIQELIDYDAPVALDIETAPETKGEPWTGKDPTRASLRSIGLGNRHWGISFLWDEATQKHKRKVQRLLQSGVIMHNGNYFDAPILRRNGFRIDRFDDTRDARKALCTTSRLSLAYLTSLYDDANPWKDKGEDDEKGTWETESMADLMRYNAQDCVETARCWEGLIAEDEWDTPRVQGLYTQMMQLSALAAEMYGHGVQVDLEERARLDSVLLAEYEVRREKLLKAIGIEGFEVNANNLRALIFKRHHTDKVRRFDLPDPWDPALWSSEETISVGQSALLILLKDYGVPDELREIVDLYWQCEAVRQVRSTFVTSETVAKATGPDGRLRPGWNNLGTDTGRWSCSRPNLMNLSEKKE